MKIPLQPEVAVSLALYHYAAYSSFAVNRCAEEVRALWQVAQFNTLGQVIHLANVECLNSLAEGVYHFNANLG
jgi:hypothetical protein